MAKKMTISKFRSILYQTAKFLGDVQAVKTGDPKVIGRRIGRRIAGKLTGRMLGRMFK